MTFDLQEDQPAIGKNTICRECNKHIQFQEEGITLYYDWNHKMHWHRGQCFKDFQNKILIIKGEPRK